MSSAIERFSEGARALGLHPEVRRFPEGTKTADAAARAIGCDVGQIVKSLIFMADDRAVLALTSGRNRVDEAKLASLTGAGEVRRATPEEAREATGFAVGGTPPFAHTPAVQSVHRRRSSRLRRGLGRGGHARLGLPAVAGRPGARERGHHRGVHRGSLTLTHGPAGYHGGQSPASSPEER